MVSAHRGGAGHDVQRENSLEAITGAVALGVDFVEFDVHRCRDGVLVLQHDAWVTDGDRRVLVSDLDHAELVRLSPLPTTTLADCLAGLAATGGGAGAHVDLKLTSPAQLYASPELTWEVEAVRQVLDALGAGRAVITTEHDASVRAVRTWARASGNDHLLVGLSLGAGPSGPPLWRRGLRLLTELFPGRRMRQCGAGVVVAHQALARLTLERWARRHRLPLLVWTVDDDRELARWLRSSAWLVTTNRPARALALRADLEH